MRVAAILATAALAGCASGAVTGDSYGLPAGVASYDALKAATDKCHADGGELKLREGSDLRELSNYECKIGGAK